jgi:hypothetical protein
VTSTSHAKARSLMQAHFELAISPDGERELRAHLAECDECSAWYDRHLLVASLDPSAPSAQQRLAQGLGLKRKSGAQSLSLQLGLGLAAVAALVLLFVGRPAEFAARGAEPAASVAQVFIYRVPAGQTSRAGQAVAGSMRSSDALAFAYVNAAGFRKLLIFAEDEHGHVYWYHPAWTDLADDPRAISIAPAASLRELPESIAHDLDGKKLKIRAIFSNAELSVRQVEALLAEHRKLGPAASRSLRTALGDAQLIEVDLAVE